MKKFFSFFAAVLFAGSMMAQFDTWSVVGSKAIMNGTADWAIAETANDMTTEDGVTYTLTVTGKTLEVGTTYEYKIAKAHKWSNGEFPSQNAELTVTETAVYDIVYTADVSAKTHSAVATKTGESGGITHTYSIAGDNAGLFGAAWSQTNTATDMTKGEDGIYRWTAENVELAAGTILYKVVVDHAWGEAYPAQNASLVIAEAATYNVVFTFNPANKAVNATATKAGVEPGPDPEPETTVYYIKHNWGGAGNWTWKEMAREGETDTYTLRDIYGGTGCNWNTVGNDAGATWVATPTLVGEPAKGDSAVFTLVNGEITITKIKSVGPGPEPETTVYYIKHNWGGAGNWTWKEMTREGETDTYTLRDIYGGTGCNWNTVGNDAGATWVATPTLVGEPAVGDSAVFTLVNGEITITKIESVGPGPEPEPEINYYLAGSMNTPAWGSVAMPGDSIVLTLAAGEYGFKVQTGEGVWDGALSYDNVNAECSSNGLYTNGDRNVMFTLENAGEVKIKVVEGQICVTGAFQVQETYSYYIAGTMNGWGSTGMDGDSIVLSLEAGEHGFKVQLVAGYWDNALGYYDLDTECSSANLYTNDDGNVMFTLAAAGEVKIKMVEGKICATGNFMKKETTGWQNVKDQKVMKQFINGQVVIIREGVRYNVMGAKF